MKRKIQLEEGRGIEELKGKADRGEEETDGLKSEWVGLGVLGWGDTR